MEWEIRCGERAWEWGPQLGRVVSKKENKKPVMAPYLGSSRCGRRVSVVCRGGQPSCRLSRLLLCLSSRHTPK